MDIVKHVHLQSNQVKHEFIIWIEFASRFKNAIMNWLLEIWTH